MYNLYCSQICYTWCVVPWVVGQGSCCPQICQICGGTCSWCFGVVLLSYGCSWSDVVLGFCGDASAVDVVLGDVGVVDVVFGDVSVIDVVFLVIPNWYKADVTGAP